MFFIIICSVLAGVVITLAVQAYFIKKYYGNLPKLSVPFKEQAEKYALPKPLRDLLEDVDLRNRRESCICLNLIIQFLFRELKDSPAMRRWLSEKMNVEFEELLHTTTGKLVDTITVRDFSVGKSFPVLKYLCVKNILPHADHLSLDELDLLIEVEYHGGFQLAVDVDLVFGKSAYLSVTVTHLRGTARIQLSRLPFTHWSFAFTEDPTIDFDVESQFEGRPMPQITSLIINQIRRSIRKKHTLPNYKVRFKPFFSKPEPQLTTPALYLSGKKLTIGQLNVTVMECSRLQKIPGDCYIFCTLSLDQLPWKQMMSNSRKRWITHDVDITKAQSQALGLLFREEFMLDRYEDVVVVETITPGSPASDVDIRKNDVIIAVNGIRVTSMKQAVKLMRQSGEKFSVRLERANSNAPAPLLYNERAIYMRNENFDVDGDLMQEEEFINISLRGVDLGRVKELDNNFIGVSTSNPDVSFSTGVQANCAPNIASASAGASPLRQGRPFSFLSAGTQIFQRRRSRDERSPSASPRDSPEMPRRHLANGGRSSSHSRSPDRRACSDGNIEVPNAVWLNQDSSQPERSNSVSQKPEEFTFVPESPSHTSLGPPVSGCPLGPQVSGTSQGPAGDFDFRSIGLKKTSMVPASVEPYWDESYTLNVDEQHDYLNVCVWYRTPEKLDKQNRVIKREKDLLLGYASVNLMQVASECMLTLQKDTQQTHLLSPPDNKPTASRNKTSLSTHPGYDEKIAHGDVSLAFCYAPHSVTMTTARSRETSPIRTRTERRQAAARRVSLDDGAIDEPESPTRRSLNKKTEEGRHDFLGTQFHTSTSCRFCGKKIWLKVAFQCRICAMICHKKCTEKCQAQTICTKDGPIPKLPLTGEQKPEVVRDKEMERPITGASGPLSKPVALLSRFTKRDSPKAARKGDDKSGSDSAKSTPVHSRRLEVTSPSTSSQSTDRRRRNSAPDDNNILLETRDDQCIPSTSRLEVPDIYRTRSSASLEELIKENLGTSSKAEDIVFRGGGVGSSCDSSDEDDERAILREIQNYQKRSHDQDELVVTAAKQMGKELYTHLSLEDRREKLDSMVTKFQTEIDQESENRSELARMEREASDLQQKMSIRKKIQKSDEKIQAVAVLMLHYCAGLQHCLDQMEEERTKDKQSTQKDDSRPSSRASDLAELSEAIETRPGSVISKRKPEESDDNCEETKL